MHNMHKYGWNTSNNNILDGLGTHFIDAEDDEGEDEDDYNTTFIGWCSKNNIMYLKENMSIDNKALNDIVADNNANEDFQIYRVFNSYWNNDIFLWPKI